MTAWILHRGDAGDARVRRLHRPCWRRKRRRCVLRAVRDARNDARGDRGRRGEARKGRSLRHGFRRGGRGKAEAESPERSGGRRRERGFARCAPSEGAGAVAWGSRLAGPANMEMPWTFEDALGSSFPPSPRAPVLGERPGRDIAGSFCGLGVLAVSPPRLVLAAPVSRCATISAREIGGEQRKAL